MPGSIIPSAASGRKPGNPLGETWVLHSTPLQPHLLRPDPQSATFWQLSKPAGLPGVSYALVGHDLSNRFQRQAMNLVGLLFVFCGLFAVAGSVCEWEWFFNHRKARMIAALIGRTGTRVFYVVLGGGLTIFGVLMCLGILPPEAAAG
ncbi:MAG: immunity 17 family protein [Bythopirellula sp.]